jgi:uncharacterized protein
MFQIHIDAIGENGLDLDRVMAADQFPLLHRFCQEAQTSFPRPVHARLHAMRSGDTVTLSGHITTAINVSCSRCLTEFELAVDVSFSTTAIPGEADDLAAASPVEMELAETEMDLITYRGATIELCDEIAQQIIMALPFNPVCRADCKGLCSTCGGNRNKTTCTCRDRDTANPFAVLKQLSVPEKKT